MSDEQPSRRRRNNAPPPPPRQDDSPPPPPKTEAEQQAEDLKNLKFTESTCRAIGKQLVGAEVVLYSVLSRVFEDERWKLQKEEIDVQENLMTIGLLVYGEQIKGVLIPIVLGVGLSAPLMGRLIMPPAKKDYKDEKQPPATTGTAVAP